MSQTFYPSKMLLRLRQACWVLLMLLFMAALLLFLPFVGTIFVCFAVLVLGLFLLRLLHNTLLLHLEDNTVVLTAGLLFHRVKRLPIQALQGVIVRADILSRLVNLRTLVLRMPGFTAFFPGLTAADAQILSDYLCAAAFGVSEEAEA